jgi:hypothetical protein
MAAATTENLGEDVEAALMLSVSEALCVAATGSPFLPNACKEAAKAYKHNAFVERLTGAVAAAARVSEACKAAEAALLAGELAGKPAAVRFIDAAGVRAKPELVGRRIVGPLGTVTTSSAPDMLRLWLLRHGVAYFGISVCSQLSETASHDEIAAKLAQALHQDLPVAAAALQESLGDSGRDPPKKRSRIA